MPDIDPAKVMRAEREKIEKRALTPHDCREAREGRQPGMRR